MVSSMRLLIGGLLCAAVVGAQPATSAPGGVAASPPPVGAAASCPPGHDRINPRHWSKRRNVVDEDALQRRPSASQPGAARTPKEPPTPSDPPVPQLPTASSAR